MTSSLLGPDGSPISSSKFRKVTAPPLGEKFGSWAGRDLEFFQMPGGSVLQINLDNLTLADYRGMRDHYQVNASLSVLTFMIHQLDWHIECEDARVRDHCEENLRELWTRLVRAISQSFWAGYSPCALQWENDMEKGRVKLTKVKDLVPEECMVKWKKVEGWAPPGMIGPKLSVYDGIKQVGMPTIPVSNSFWYPLLMENGNYYGKKLLKSAYASWFFSLLLHLFANRYYERFGEPVPVGRAPYDETISVDGTQMTGDKAMLKIMTQLRSRAAVVLPSDRTQIGDGSQSYPDYELEYLESQMRGADFQKYHNQLDEEISLALFTPLLILRTADVGSYNLGVGHMQVYLWMLNALAGDFKEYIDRYILRPMRDYNFGVNAKKPVIVFRKLGKENVETVRAVIQELVRKGTAKPSYLELGQMSGLTLEEVEVVTEPPPEPGADPDDDPESDPDTRGPRDKPRRSGPRGTGEPRATGRRIKAGMRTQVALAYRHSIFTGLELDYRTQMYEALEANGYPDPATTRDAFYSRLELYLADLIALAGDSVISEDDFKKMFEAALEAELSAIDAKKAA